MAKKKDTLFTVREIAKYCGVSLYTIRRWVKRGLPHTRNPSNHIMITYPQIDGWMMRFAKNVR